MGCSRCRDGGDAVSAGFAGVNVWRCGLCPSFAQEGSRKCVAQELPATISRSDHLDVSRRRVGREHVRIGKISFHLRLHGEGGYLSRIDCRPKEPMRSRGMQRKASVALKHHTPATKQGYASGGASRCRADAVAGYLPPAKAREAFYAALARLPRLAVAGAAAASAAALRPSPMLLASSERALA